jgi:hypothetical protein
MEGKQFEVFWEYTYPKTVPLSWRLKEDYRKQWFRVHSLPKSKRYAHNKYEWKILLNRQNDLITDLLGEGSDFYIVTGRWMNDNDISENKDDLVHYREWNFTELEPINMFVRYPKEYDEEDDSLFYIPALTNKLIWNKGRFDELLRAIANDETSAIFVGVEQHCLIAPYDGGIDCIVANENLVDFYKNKYSDWLPWLGGEL